MNHSGLEPGTSQLYIPPGAHGNEFLDPKRYVHEYGYWHLVLQPEELRQLRGGAAGILVAKREVVLPTDLYIEEWADLSRAFKDGDAPRRLCEAAGLTFTECFTGPAFNNGQLAGQSQAQVHAYIYPVVAEELPLLGAQWHGRYG